MTTSTTQHPDYEYIPYSNKFGGVFIKKDLTEEEQKEVEQALSGLEEKEL